MGPCTVYITHLPIPTIAPPIIAYHHRQAGISRQHLKKIHLASFHQTSDFPDFLRRGTRFRKDHSLCSPCNHLSSPLVFLLSVWQVETLQLLKGMEPLLTTFFRFFPLPMRSKFNIHVVINKDIIQVLLIFRPSYFRILYFFLHRINAFTLDEHETN